MGEVSGVASTFLSEDEYLCIPEHVRKKIDSYLLKQTEEVNLYRALALSQKRDYEQQISDLESNLSCKSEDYFTVKKDLSNALCEASDLQKKLQSLQNENLTLHQKTVTLEKQFEEYKLRHDAALVERDNARRELEQRLCEIRVCHSEIESLTQKFDAVTTENCRILRETGYLKTKEVDLKVREKELDDERDILMQQISSLKNEMKKTMEQNSYLEREHAVRRNEFEVHLSHKEEELRVIQEANEELTATVEKLKEQLEISKQTIAQERENMERLHENHLKEIQAHKTMVNEHKGQRDNAVSKAQYFEYRLEGVQKELEETMEQYEKMVGSVEEHNSYHEKRHKQLEKEKEKLKEELEIANEMVKTALKENLERDVEDLSPLLASVKRMLKPGTRLTQIFVSHAELLQELEQEQNRNCRLQKHMDAIIEELETRTPLLKMQMSDLTEAVKQNAEMELKFKEVLLELMSLRKSMTNMRTNLNPDDDFGETEKSEMQQDTVDVEKSDNFRDVADIVDYLRTRPQLVSTKEFISETTPKRFFGSNSTADNERLFPKSSFDEGSLARNKMSFEEAEISGVTQQGQLALFKQQLNHMAKQLESKSMKVMDMAIQSDPLPPDENIEKLQKDLADKDDIIKDLQKQVGQETVLRQQLDERTVQGASMAAQLQVAQDGLKVLQANTAGYKTKLVEVEKKSRNFSATISKQEGIIQQLKHMLDDMQRRLEHADLQIRNLQRDNEILRNVQIRSVAQQELLTVERQRTDLLFSHLEKLQSSINQSEEEGRLRLQSSLEKYVAECAELKLKLQKSQEQSSEDSRRLQKEVENSRKECTLLSQQIESLERRLTDKDVQITELSSVMAKRPAEITKLQSCEKDDQADTLIRKLKESELELSNCRLKLQTTEELLETSRTHSVIYKDSCLKLEKDHQKLIEDFNLFRDNSTKREEEAAVHIAALSQQIADLKQDLEAARAFEVKLEDCCKELENTKITIENLKSELQEQQARTLAAEVKYSQQLLAHRDDEKIITSLRERVQSLETELSDVRLAKVKAENLLQNRNEVWQRMEESWRQELQSLEKLIDTLNNRNENLYKQLGEVSSRALTCVQMGAPNPSKRKRSDSEERAHEVSVKEGDATGESREDGVEDNQVPPPCKKALLSEEANATPNVTTADDTEKDGNEAAIQSYEISSIAKSYEKLRNIIKTLHEEKNAAIVKSRTSEDNVTALYNQRELVNTGKDITSDKEKKFEEDLLASTRQSNILKNESFNSLSETNLRFCKERDDLEKQLRVMREHCAVLETRLSEQDKTELETEKVKVRMLQKRVTMMRKKQNRVNKQIIMEKLSLLRENEFLRRTKRLKNETIADLRKRLRQTLNCGYKIHVPRVEEGVRGAHEVDQFKQGTSQSYEYEDTRQHEEQEQPHEQHHQDEQVRSEEDDVCLVDLAEEEDNTAQDTEEPEYHDPLYTNDTGAPEYQGEEDPEYHTPEDDSQYQDPADSSEYQEHAGDPHYQHVEEDSQYHHPNGEAEYASGDEHQPYVCGVEPDYAEEDNEDAYDYEEEFQDAEEQEDILHQHEPVERETVMTLTRTIPPGQLEDVEEEEEEEEDDDVDENIVTVLDSEDAESEEHSTNVNLQRLLRSGNISLVKRKDRPRNPNISGNGS
ncbi:nucleoprotein TPR-like isoform X1 [Schistocerca serialis cubense]|uniref:nucleoprotein TPR-like isoform X1 n=1 Tax=Schistocerca serialis cubense TaxID=2023355 RepID=UPI00214E2B4D|nr:nucleoprotein TPR-like isoform X1 [Schistocerca serialis cubense]